MSPDDVIKQSARLRGQSEFRSAIDLVKRHLAAFDDTTVVNAYLEMFYAAKEAKLTSEALAYANKLVELEPGLPTAADYLRCNTKG